MFKNHLVSVLRNLRRKKFHTVIYAAGPSVGIHSRILIIISAAGFFIFVTLLSINIALLNMAYQALKVANSNPVKALRYE